MSKHAKSDRNADSRDENGKNAANNIFKEENPFHSLDVSRFPKKKTGAEREPRVSKKQFRLADNVARDEDSFAELMLLSGVESLPPKGVVSEQDARPKSGAGSEKQRRAPGETGNAHPEKDGLNRRGTERDEENAFLTLGDARGFDGLKNGKASGKNKGADQRDANGDGASGKTAAPGTEHRAAGAGRTKDAAANFGAAQRDRSASKAGIVRNNAKNAENRDKAEFANWLGEKARIPDEDEDLEMFARAVGGVAPLDRKGRDIPVPPAKRPGPGEKSDIQALRDLVDGKVEFAMEMTEEYIEGHVIGLDHLVIAKMRAGNYHPEAHLDMHGLNANQAYEHLVGFMRGAYYKGFRCVLVIPGRGKNSPDGLGVLREKLQLWLTQEPFKRVVLAFCTAQAVHGGPGALYVLLRKYKKNRGKIHWDRLPADPDLY